MEIALIILLIIALGSFFGFRFYIDREKNKKAVANAKDLIALKVLVPKGTGKKEEGEEGPRDFRESLSIAEQFLASFTAMHDPSFTKKLFGQERISFEIIAKNNLVTFYILAPKVYRELIERQLHSFYPDAQLQETDQFKIFDKPVFAAGRFLKTVKSFVFPIRTYRDLESDPLNAVTNAFSKMPETATGGLQIILRPTSGDWVKGVSSSAKALSEGKSLSKQPAIIEFFSSIFKLLRSQEEKPKEPVKLTPIQEEQLKKIQEKGSKVGFKTQIRLLVISQQSQQEADSIVHNISSSFTQFNAPDLNSLKVSKPKDITNFVSDYILRRFRDTPFSILNTTEIASILHLPNQYIDTPNIEWLLARTVAPPANLPGREEGSVMLGKSYYRGVEKEVRIKQSDRRRHLYAIGKTGVGKTTLFVNQVIQDIYEGRGVAYLDPNGDAIETILSYIPKERAEDVIIFDPSDAERPVGLNMLEWKRPEDRDFLVAEWLEIFYKLFDPNRTGMVGPQFEHWGRNASLSVMMRPEGGTLLDIPRMFIDDAFREDTLRYVTDPIVASFWNEQMAKTGEAQKSEMYNYFISKFGRFMTNDLMRNIIGQTKSSFDFRQIMDEGKIFLVNLSKGKIGETNSYLLGMVLVAKMQVAAFQRADTPEEERKDFYLYVDEFQNFTTDNFKTILSEARKYRLNLNITNQYVAQLPEDIRNAIIGNAGTLITFRIGAEDAEALNKEFDNVTPSDIANLPFATTYIKLLIDGAPAKPFSMTTVNYPEGANPEMAKAIKELSRLKFGKDKDIVEQEFLARGYDKIEDKDLIPDFPPPREGQ